MRTAARPMAAASVRPSAADSSAAVRRAVLDEAAASLLTLGAPSSRGDAGTGSGSSDAGAGAGSGSSSASAPSVGEHKRTASAAAVDADGDVGMPAARGSSSSVPSSTADTVRTAATAVAAVAPAQRRLQSAAITPEWPLEAVCTVLDGLADLGTPRLDVSLDAVTAARICAQLNLLRLDRAEFRPKALRAKLVRLQEEYQSFEALADELGYVPQPPAKKQRTQGPGAGGSSAGALSPDSPLDTAAAISTEQQQVVYLQQQLNQARGTKTAADRRSRNLFMSVLTRCLCRRASAC